MRWISLAMAVALALLAAAACGGDSTPKPGPTMVSLTKTVVDMTGGQFRFTLKVTNEGKNPAVNLTASDFWDAGLQVTAIGSVGDQQPKAIEDRGLDFILKEFGAGKSAELVYVAKCRKSGEWVNAAAAGAANAKTAEASVKVTCP